MSSGGSAIILFDGHGCSGMIPVLSGLQKHHLKVCNRLSEVQASCSTLQSAFASLHTCLHRNSQLSCEGTSILSAHVAQHITDHVAAYTPVQVALFCWQAETHCPSNTQDTAACAVAIHTSVWYLTHFSTRKCFASLISNSPCTHMTFKHLLDLFLLELKLLAHLQFDDLAGSLTAGKTSGKVPADQGVMQGTLSNSVDSFMLCA